MDQTLLKIFGLPRNDKEALDQLVKIAEENGIHGLVQKALEAKRMQNQGKIIGPHEMGKIDAGLRIISAYKKHKLRLVSITASV